MNPSFLFLQLLGHSLVSICASAELPAGLRLFIEVDGDKELVRFGHARNQWRWHVSTRSYNEHGVVGVSLDELLARLLQNALLEVRPGMFWVLRSTKTAGAAGGLGAFLERLNRDGGVAVFTRAAAGHNDSHVSPYEIE